MKDSEMLNYINNGAIDYYHGLKIETKLTFEELCDNISKKINESNEKYNNYIKVAFRNDINQAIQKQGFCDNLRIINSENPDNSEIMTKINENSDLKDEISGIEFAISDNKFNIIPRTYVDEYYSVMYDENNYDFDYSKNIYGNIYVNSQSRFILPPIKLELENNAKTMLGAMLYVFQNKFAVLRLTLPIDNVGSQLLKNNESDNYIVSAKTIFGFTEPLNNKSLEAIKDCYCRFLAGINKVNAVVCFKRIVNILLANHSSIVDDIKKMPDKLKEEIYKISFAPIQERNGVSYIEEATKHFNKNSFIFNGIGYFLSSMGKCVSFVDNSVLTFAKENFEENIVFKKIISDLRRNVEFPIILMLLKNINDSYSFEQKGLTNKKLSEIKNDYNINKIFISMLQTGAYGSVRELTNKFEESMTYFLDVENTEERMSALNSVLEDEQARRTLQLQNIVSIVGLIFAIIFGLPAINETLFHIRNLCFFVKQDIPCVSVANCSFVIWCLTIIGLSIFIFRNSKTKTRYK